MAPDYLFFHFHTRQSVEVLTAEQAIFNARPGLALA